jgi:hypothetical protein
MKTAEQVKEDAEEYAKHWLVNAIEKVKAELSRSNDVPSVLEVAFTDGYRTGYAHACDNSGYKQAQITINELKDVLTMVLHEWDAPEVYQAQIAEVLGVTRPD